MSKEKGLPIYLDIERKLMDSVHIDDTKHEWQPGNDAAHKLYRCVECLRDLLELLEDARHLQNSTKRRRRAKLLFTPLHSLAECVLDLLNDCESNPDTVQKMPAGATKLISELRKLFLQNVPIGKDGLLSKLRDKTSAHVDKGLWPSEARKLIATPELHEIGFWLDTSVSVLCDLLKLPVYFWSCESPYPDVVRIMMCEPMLVSMRLKDGKMTQLVGVHFVKRSPREDVNDLIFKVVEQSRWLFRPGDTQIRSFDLDGKDTPWAKSLKTIPPPGKAP
jgi:hypothetical protein